MLSAGFKPAISASEQPQTHALDRTATGIGYFKGTKRKSSEYDYQVSSVISLQLRKSIGDYLEIRFQKEDNITTIGA
jgi:hypothetical protein